MSGGIIRFIVSEAIAQTVKDPDCRKQLLDRPKQASESLYIQIPPEQAVTVILSTPGQIFLTIPIMTDRSVEILQAGLIKGGSLDNALVCNDREWLNPPLRFPNEPSRHKLLDLIGDLSLLGKFPQAHFLAYKASHNLHIQLAQKLHEMGY